ncbi:MAG: cardiolipin synthase [Gammaproteobacteria bacterium]|nr:cardiolipin synthase [Gammaproteobacteria bacterium]
MSYTVVSIIILITHFVLALGCTGHILLNKRDPRAALGWIMVCVFITLIGPLFYWIFGVNRVQRRARRLFDKSPSKFFAAQGIEIFVASGELEISGRQSIQEFLNVSSRICRLPVHEGNKVEILFNGDQAYPAMLNAIENARECVYLMTYIFDTDDQGNRFIEALVRCKERGVEVKVLVDGVGELGRWRRASTQLASRGINVERFLPLTLKPPAFYWNLRNHRKLLVTDHNTAFTGGINISARHMMNSDTDPSRVEDLHFKLLGPIVADLEAVFLDDWEFVTGQHLEVRGVEQSHNGDALCRVIVDEPSENIDRLAITLAGAVSAARQRILVMTPYFLPSRELLSALQTAALRNLDVTILLPAQNDNVLVHWATRNLLWQLLQFDVKVYYQPPPFVHSKLFIIDDQVVFFGSANIDPRSLRLNFELNIEAYDAGLVEQLMQYVDRKIARSRLFTMQDVESRSLPVRYRDGLAWLCSPYL